MAAQWVPIVVLVLLLILGIAVALDALLVLALYAASKAGVDWECTDNLGGELSGDDAKCEGRTAGIGISVAILSIIVLIIMLVYFILTLVFRILVRNLILHIVGALLMVFLSIICACGMFVAWALMASDISDFVDGDNVRNADSCDSPNVWSAALAFGLFGSMAWVGMAILSCIWFATRFCFPPNDN